jgi:hypothetical protein
MKVTYPAPKTVSVWVGTFRTEDDFDRCVDGSVSKTLALDTELASICEVAFQTEPTSVGSLLDGFSGFETFSERALSAASSRSIETANCALVCYHLDCREAPDDWDGLRFLGSFPGQDIV